MDVYLHVELHQMNLHQVGQIHVLSQVRLGHLVQIGDETLQGIAIGVYGVLRLKNLSETPKKIYL